MSYKLHMNTAYTNARFDPKFAQAQKFIDSQVLKDTDPYVPMKTGNLKRSGISGTAIGTGEVVYNAPYSRKMYYGKGFNFDKSKHPKACAEWFEKSKAVNKTAWIEGAEKVVKGE